MMIGLLGLVLTVAIYWGCKRLYRRFPIVVLTPLVSCLVVIVVLLSVTHVPYTKYMTGAHWLSSLLGPAVVSFAVPLHKNFALLKRHAPEILASLFIGCFTAITSSVIFAILLRLNHTLAVSLAPRSVTTPIAMDISGQVGGIPTLTAVFVIITALIGIFVGPLTIRHLRIKSPVGKGMLLGMGAHGVGTSKAFDIGPLEGTFASLAMIVAAGLSSVLALVLVSRL